MKNASNPLIRITELEQVGFVVRDVVQSAVLLWNTFGIGPWHVNDMDAETMDETTYYGKPAQFSFRIAHTPQKVGAFEIELIQPLEGDTIYRDFLRDHGEGFHHFGWHRTHSLKDFNRTIQALENAGYPCIMSGRIFNVGSFAYMDTTKVLNGLLEVVYEGSPPEKPPPKLVIPG